MIDTVQGPAYSLEALRTGNREEFARLVDATAGAIYRLALKMVGEPQDAEDILQETYLKAFRSLPRFEGRSSLSTWLYRIAVNEALMLLRKRRPQLITSLDAETDGEEGPQEAMQIVDWCCLPERELVTGEARAYLDSAVDRLPDTLKVVFLLRDIEGLSIRETAEALGLSETAVKTRLLRARLNLRNQLSSYFGERMAEKNAHE